MPPWRTLAARALIRVHRLLVRVRTHQRHYILMPDGSTRYLGRRWDSWPLAWRALEAAHRVDAEHWAHWALEHTDCGCESLVRCGVCGGEGGAP
jgi:hypothetical protein